MDEQKELAIALRYFAQSFLEMGKHLRAVQTQASQVFSIINSKFGGESTKESLPFYVNGTVWFGAVSDIAQNLATMATSMSTYCNSASGKKIDTTGDIHDLFQQQRSWNERHGKHFESFGEGDEKWN